MESLPPAIVDFLHLLRPVVRAEVLTSCFYWRLGILMGEANYGTARASVVAGPGYWPQRLADLWCRHTLSPQVCMAKRGAAALACRSPAALPARLLGSAEST